MTKLLNSRIHNTELTPRGQDLYHDLEKWVTYRFIQPLWEEMMRELDPLDSRLRGGRRTPSRGALARLIAGAGMTQEASVG